MDIATTPASVNNPFYNPPVNNSSKSDHYQVSAGNDGTGQPENPQAQYESEIRKAASSFKDAYPLGDTSFSLFKDTTGTLITRYTSLIDGKITYVPEPTLVRHLQENTVGSSNAALISISA